MTSVTQLRKTAVENIAAGAKHLGDIASWNVQEVDLPRADLAALLERFGFDAYLSEIDATGALNRAKQRVHTKGVLVRTFSKTEADTTMSVGVYLEKQQADELASEFACGARVRIKDDHAVAFAPRNVDPEETCAKHARAMADYANHLIDYVATQDLTNALIDIVRAEFGAVPIKNGAGVYFVPAEMTPKWRELSHAIGILTGAKEHELSPGVSAWEGGSFQPITLEITESSTSIQTVATSAKESLEYELRELTADLDKALGEGGFAQKRTIVNRLEWCQELFDRAKLYGNVLQGFVGELQNRTDAVKAKFEAELTAHEGGKRPSLKDLVK